MTVPQPESGARAEILDAIVQVLQRSGRFSDQDRRHAIVREVAQRTRRRMDVAQSPDERLHLLMIIRECARRGCLSDLLDCVCDDVDRWTVWRLRQLNDEWDGIEHFTDRVWLAIKDTLEQVDVSNGTTLFNTAQWRNPKPPHCRNVWHLFAYLAGSNGDDEGVPYFMTFLRMVADQLETQDGRPLKRLLDQLASEWNITDSFQRVYRTRTREVGRADQTAALLILIDPHPLNPGMFTVMHWYGWAPERTLLVKGGEDLVVAEAGLEHAVRDIVKQAEEGWPTDDQQLRIEFILPFELLNLPVERWPKELDPEDGPVPFYKHYAVVVRSLDRIRRPDRHRVWRARWHMLEDTPTQARCQYSEDARDRLEETITRDRRIVALVLSEPPVPASGEGMSEIRIAIRTGIPIIIWHRSHRFSDEFRRVIDESMYYGDIAKLPDRVFDLRLDQSMSNDERADIGNNLVVLWDDPVRLPEEFRAASGGGY
ncbi:hypothetical protein ACIBSW_11400 [Actinoplanes sp. NPDC049668]|uniref:VMAP-C domain-containing protein n=1 Tax=unclassified Actinoplanes TaxID=2626549 RepID=UPI0033AC909E